MQNDIAQYNNNNTQIEKDICNTLATQIDVCLSQAECKIWHSHPVWFLDKNPIVGYSKQKQGIRLMFWSGIDFNDDELNIKGQKFKDASIFYTNSKEINIIKLQEWLHKAENIQWDYKNIVKRKGRLERLK